MIIDGIQPKTISEYQVFRAYGKPICEICEYYTKCDSFGGPRKFYFVYFHNWSLIDRVLHVFIQWGSSPENDVLNHIEKMFGKSLKIACLTDCEFLHRPSQYVEPKRFNYWKKSFKDEVKKC